MPKDTNPVAEHDVEVPAKKSKKKLVIIIAAAVLLIGGGSTAFLLLTPSPKQAQEETADEDTETAGEDEGAEPAGDDEGAEPAGDDEDAEPTGDEEEENNEEAEEEQPDVPPVYAQLGTFTANLIHEEGDRYLQVSIELKLTVPELVEKIKATNPEILHHINMLLQSKRPSDLASLEGKQKLAEQIKGQVEYVLGLRKSQPAITETGVTTTMDEQAVKKPSATSPEKKTGVAEVLFTSFIIQ